MLYWLLGKGFTEEQIKNYVESKKYKLEELINDSNTQIDNIISTQLKYERIEKMVLW